MAFLEHRPNAPKRRQERDIERVRRTAAEVPAEQRSAMAIALAQIGAAFDAAAVSMPLIRACAWGERTKQAWVWPGRWTSAV